MRLITKLQISFEGQTQPLLIREGEVDDIHFVTNSWVRGYRKNSTAMELIPQQIYSSNQYPIVIALLQRSSLIVACNVEDHDQIFGWSCVETIAPGEKVVHFIYVKSAFRRCNIGKALLHHSMGENVTYYTHRTALTQYLYKQRLCVFNPFLINQEATKHVKSEVSNSSSCA